MSVKTSSKSKQSFPGFDKELLHFLDDLTVHNDRDWFAENKERYEQYVREPALAFIRAMQGPLATISPHFQAVAKKSGGSLMRIYRDVRFSKDKSPYKTNVGIQFRHELGKDVHAPGFYFHIDPESIFVGAGVWRPDSKALQQIRSAIDEQPQRWKRAKNAKSFREQFELTGESLKRAPRDFDADHPLIDDLKRKDFVAICPLKPSQLTRPTIIREVTERFRAAKPLVRFLCEATYVPF